MRSGRLEENGSLAAPNQSPARSRAGTALSALAALGLGALVLATIVALAVAIAPAENLPATGAPASPTVGFASTDSNLAFVLQLGNRLYPEWKEDRRVRLQERFVIGDTPYSAAVTQLLPDFRIIDGKPQSLTGMMNNPAARVMVYRDSSAADSSWAFLNFPPHFSPRSFFTFQLKEVIGYANVVTPLLTTDAGANSPAAHPQGNKSLTKKD